MHSDVDAPTDPIDTIDRPVSTLRSPVRAFAPPEAILLRPREPDRPRRQFHRDPVGGNSRGVPRAIAWFGFRSFWGHLRRFAASAIATEDVDTRDWMEPTPPPELVAKVARTLGADDTAPTLAECLGRDVWIDFVADSGDDGALAERVGHLLFRDYRATDPLDPSAELLLPRGDLLIHGGDVAYPVATAGEIHDRLIVPWNRALRDLGDDSRTRVLLGVPGNHDWYDGIDGFARMFRERHLREEPEAPTEPLDVHWFGRTLSYLGQFLAGETVQKAKALVLAGYKPLQRSSYFILPITRNLHVHAVDRQLRRIDYRQSRFFRDHQKEHPDAARILILPDPVLPFGMPSRSGLAMLRSLRLSPEYEPHLCFAGDIHHYRRETIGRSTHVTCGGGGAFLHPAPLGDDGHAPAEVEWPGKVQTKALLAQSPMHVAAGRSGLIAHAVMLLCFMPALGVGANLFGRDGLVPASIVAGALAAVAAALLGTHRGGRIGRIIGVAVVFGVLMGLVPSLTLLGLEPFGDALGIANTTAFWGLLVLAVALLAGGFLFGAFLAALTHFDLEHTQAFTALSHPGFRHFIRMRVRADGSGVDVFAVGLEDPFAPDEPPVLVDAFTWVSPVASGECVRRSSIHPEPGALRSSVDRRRSSIPPPGHPHAPSRASVPPPSHPPAPPDDGSG